MKKLKVDTIYSQRDGRWSGVMLGFNTNQPYTIGNFGCLLTVLAMYVKALGKEETPTSLNDKLKQVNGFVNGREYVWTALNKVFGDINIKYQSPRYDSAVSEQGLSKMRSLIDEGNLLVVEIDFNPSTVSEEMHYLGVYGYDDNNKFYAVDPWTGSKIDVAVYGDIKRVMYRFTAYDKALAFESSKPQITIDGELYEMLVGKATKYDEFVASGYDSPSKVKQDLDSKNKTIDNLNQQINDRKGDITRLTAEVSTLTAQLKEVTTQKDLALEQAKQVPSLTEQVTHLEEKVKGQQSEIESLTRAIGQYKQYRPKNKSLLKIYELLMSLDKTITK